MGYQDIEESRIYQRSEQICDQVWDLVTKWERFARDTVGKQLVRSIDSIGANIAESAGRYHPNDVVRFLYYARGSIRESRFWLKRAKQRQLIVNDIFEKELSELEILTKEINSYINFQRNRRIKEPDSGYAPIV
jgi:four helix bundle protein